jgi:hypothetical protein
VVVTLASSDEALVWIVGVVVEELLEQVALFRRVWDIIACYESTIFLKAKDRRSTECLARCFVLHRCG